MRFLERYFERLSLCCLCSLLCVLGSPFGRNLGINVRIRGSNGGPAAMDTGVRYSCINVYRCVQMCVYMYIDAVVRYSGIEVCIYIDAVVW